jgi:hypothetical protein
VRFSGRTWGRIPSFKYQAEASITIEVIVTPDTTTKAQTVFGNFEHSGLGLELYNGHWAFVIHNGTEFLRVKSDVPAVKGRRVHLAACWDLNEATLYVNGRKQKESAELFGRHQVSPHPFLIGADPNARGAPEHYFEGTIRAIHVSAGKRYQGDSYAVSKNLSATANSVALLDFSRVSNRGANPSLDDMSSIRRKWLLYQVQWEKNP